MTLNIDYIKQVIIPYEQAAYNYYQLRDHDPRFVAEIMPDSFGYLLNDDGTLIIAIRGTLHEEEWLRDFDEFAVQCLFAQGYVHKGIQEQYYLIRNSILDILNAALKANVFPYKKIVIIGHSLGGALAVLLTYELLSMGFDPTHIETYTLEAPRVLLGNLALSSSKLDSVVTRIEYKWDVVPHYPHSLFGYISVGRGVLVSGPFVLDFHINHALKTLLAGVWPAVSA